MKIDPIHQFNIEPLFTIGHIGNQTIAFTNSSLYMFMAVALTAVLMLGGADGSWFPAASSRSPKSPTSSSPARSAARPARKA